MTAPAHVPGAVFFRRSYLLLLLGGMAAGGSLVFLSGIGEHVESSRILLFLLWIESPFLLLAFNVYCGRRFFPYRGDARLYTRGILLFLGSGVIIYGRALFLPADHAMDRNLVFLWGPFYHMAAAAVVTAGFLARSLHVVLNRRARRQDP